MLDRLTAAPGIGIIASVIIMAFGMWWLTRAEAAARKEGEVYRPREGAAGGTGAPAVDEKTREHATVAGDFDPAELANGKRADSEPPFLFAVLPLVVVIAMNVQRQLVLPPATITGVP